MFKSEKLALHIRQLIENNQWKTHEKLPSLREQAQLSGYSLITVLNAYQTLETLGLIYAKEKSGYYVAEKNSNIAQLKSNIHPAENIQINSVVFHYLKQTQTQGIVPFGSAFPNPELLYNPKFMQLLAQHAKRKNSYLNNDNMPPGNLALRQIIASRYMMQGVECNSDDIVITSGALNALNLALEALTRPTDVILLQETVFYGAWQAAERLGLQVVTIPDHHEFGIDIEAFEQALQQYPVKVCWLMLNTQNPMGFTVSNTIKKKIASLLEQYQVYLIEDDVYLELGYGAKKPLPMTYFDQHQRVLHCSTFSKSLGMGTRVGWIHARQFSDAIQHLQLMSTLSVSPLVQNALVDFLSHHHYEKHLRHLSIKLAQYKQAIYAYLKLYLPAQCKINIYPSGYFLWIQLPEHCDSYLIYQKLLQHQISIAPSLLFRPKHSMQNAIRLNCSFELTADIQQSLDLLCTVITQSISKNL